MEEKFFMHRIKEEAGSFVKGIEIHDTKESAILSFWAYSVYAWNNPDHPDVSFVSCKITDMNGNVIAPYELIWRKSNAPIINNKYFMHHIRKDGDTFSKDIDILSDFDAARLAFGKAMAYGYGNPRHADVSYVFCMITDLMGTIMTPYIEKWIAPEPEPEPEPESSPEIQE